MDRIFLSKIAAARVIGGLLVFLALAPGSLMLAGCDLADPIRVDTMSAKASGGLRVLLQSSKSINVPSNFFSPSISFFDGDDGLIEKVEVTITRVELRGKGGERITLSDESQTFDLLELQGGEKALLVKWEDLPNKSYNRIDLTISEAAVVLDLEVKTVRLEAKGKKKVTTVPLPDFKIESTQLAKLALNVDLEKSFTIKAHPDLHLRFNPVVEALGFNYEAWGAGG